MAIPLFTGSVSVPSSGSFTNNASTTALNATGANTVTSNTTGSAVAFILNNSNGTPTSGDLLDVQKGGSNKFQVLNSGGVTSQGLGTFVGLSAGTGTVKGASDGSTNTYLLPAYVAAGTAVASTAHMVVDVVTANGATTTISLSGAAVFTSALTYAVLVLDASANTVVTAVTTISGSSFSFSSTSTHKYSFLAIGT